MLACSPDSYHISPRAPGGSVYAHVQRPTGASRFLPGHSRLCTDVVSPGAASLHWSRGATADPKWRGQRLVFHRWRLHGSSTRRVSGSDSGWVVLDEKIPLNFASFIAKIFSESDLRFVLSSRDLDILRAQRTMGSLATRGTSFHCFSLELFKTVWNKKNSGLFKRGCLKL